MRELVDELSSRLAALEERRDLGSSTGEAEAAASSAQTQEAAEEEEEEAEAHDGQEAEEPGAAGTSNDPEGERAGPSGGTSSSAAGGVVPSEPSTAARRVIQTAGMPHGGAEENRTDGALDPKAASRDSKKGPSPEMVRYQPGLSQHGRARVVICGHDYVFWAAKYAARTSWGLDIGLGAHAMVEWRGQRGMLWDGFSQFASQSSLEAPPAILVIHLGGNDLPQVTGKSLILRVIADLRSFKARFPETRLVWSALTPRRVWPPARTPQQVDKARKGMNREVSKAVQDGLGSVIQHPGIVIRRPELYREDGVQLSDLGLNIFLQDLEGGLKAELFGNVGGKEHTG